MSNIKEIRKRIKSVTSTAKITHAMEMVAAAKMKKAQVQATAGKPYSNLINKVLRSISNNINPETHPLLARSKGDKSAVIFFSTDKGLAGSLNSNLFRKIEELVGQTKYITLGKKARNFISKTGRELTADFELAEKPTLENVRPISKLVIDGFLKGEFDQVYVLYTEFVSILVQDAKIAQILPIIDNRILAELAKEAQEQENTEPVFEPNADAVLESILPQYILMELYHVLLEAKASEHSARMVAMKNATDNASEMVDDLTLTYNSIRQTAITSEILDISTAQVAME